MPLPIILGAVAATAGVIGVGTGLHGASKMKDASDTIEAAENRHKSNTAKFEMISEMTSKKMDELGTLELTILKEFDMFSNTCLLYTSTEGTEYAAKRICSQTSYTLK